MTLDARSGTARAMDRRLDWLWDKGLFFRLDLDPDALWAYALKKAPSEGEGGGRSAEDIADFRQRLRLLAASVDAEAGLAPLGEAMAWGQLVRVIRQRLYLGALWQKEPGLTRTPIAPPIIVIGQMRSGTTRVHRLLAADPAHCGTRFCDSWNPVPERPDWRPLKAAATLRFMNHVNPWGQAIHPVTARQVDEELGWLAAALDHSTYAAQWRIDAFTRWSEARDPAPVWREFARILRTDAACHGNADRPRVMKVPQMAEDLPTVLAAFPDARVVVTRRDSGAVLESSISLAANQMAVQSESVDLAALEQEWKRKIALREARISAGLAGFSGPVSEVNFDAMGEDWRGTMERVYRELSLEFTSEAEAAMAREHQRASGGAHRDHARQMAGTR